jgi:hypothetical protein
LWWQWAAGLRGADLLVELCCDLGRDAAPPGALDLDDSLVLGGATAPGKFGLLRQSDLDLLAGPGRREAALPSLKGSADEPAPDPA